MTKRKRTLNDLLASSGGRRFFVSLLSLASSHSLVWYGRISGDAYALVMVGVVAAFITGATVQHIKGTTK